MMDTPERPVWQRCWCYRFGRCLVDCPTADLPRPAPLTDDAWRQAYEKIMRYSAVSTP